MNSASRPVATGKTRTCPHCKATILESLSICPGCLHHLRFDQEAAKRQVAATSALRVEGLIRHPPLEETWEYYVVIAIRNDRGEEVTRQVVNVGALQAAEKRTFTLSVEVLPSQAPAAKPGQAQGSGAKAPAASAQASGSSTVRTPGAGASAPAPGSSTKAQPGAPTPGSNTGSNTKTPGGAPLPPGGPPGKRS